MDTIAKDSLVPRLPRDPNDHMPNQPQTLLQSFP